MKTKQLLKKLAAVVICFAMAFAAKAQTTATTVADLQSQFTAAVATGTPQTITIGAAIAVTADLSLVSTGDSITLNFAATPAYPITVTAGTFTIGNKVKITSALGNCVQALVGGTVVVNAGCNIFSTATSPVTAAGGNVIINGGKVFTSNNFPAASAGLSASVTGGTLTINGGYLATNATGTARGVGIDFGGVCIVNGGEIHSDMGGGRGISINATNSGGKLYVNGGKITALGATGRAIQADNNNAFVWIKGSPVITGGLEAIIAQKYAVVVVSGTPTITGVIGTNLVAGTPVLNPILYDARAINITATPVAGYYAASQSVTVNSGTMSVLKYTGASSGGTGAGVTNPATVTPTTLVYTTDGTNPVAASTAYSAPVTVAMPTVLNVAPIIEGTVVGCPVTFNYWPTGTPMTSAPTPTAPASKVASIFSDAYQTADPAGTQFRPDWGQPTAVSTIQVGGKDNVLKYGGLTYEGTQFANPVNAADLKYLHVDAFSSDETSLQITPISPGTPNKEFAVALTPINLNAWNSYNIPLSSFTGVDMSNLIQLKVVGSGGKTVYLDNIYFWTDTPANADTQAPTAFTAAKGTVTADAVTLSLNATDNSGVVFFDITYGTKTVTSIGLLSGVQSSVAVTGLTGSTDYSFSIVARDRTGNAIATPIVVTATTLTPMPAAPTPTKDPAKVKSIYSDTYTPAVTVTEWSNWWMMNFSDYLFPGNNNGKMAVSTNPGGCGSPTFVATPLDATGMTYVHVDVFPTSTFTISIQFVTLTTTTANWVSLGTLNVNQWNSIDVPISSFTNSVKTDIKQVGFQTTASIGTFYLDNLYFYTDLGSGVSTVTNNSIKCYPSQVSTNLNITADSEIAQIVIRNLVGQTVQTVTANSREKLLNLSTLAAGNYLVSVKLANGESSNQKIVKL